MKYDSRTIPLTVWPFNIIHIILNDGIYASLSVVMSCGEGWTGCICSSGGSCATIHNPCELLSGELINAIAPNHLVNPCTNIECMPRLVERAATIVLGTRNPY